jgi:hypothetical protein
MQNSSILLMGRLVLASATLAAASALADERAAGTGEQLAQRDITDELTALKRRIEELENRQRAAEQEKAAAPAPAGTSGPMLGYFTLPGTNTRMKIGGYVKLDAIYDVNGPQGDLLNPAQVPLHASGAAGNLARRDGNTRIHARESRINLDTRTASDLGEIHTFIESDFFGAGGGNELSTNSYNFRLRRAFAEFGPFLAGQDYTNFMDLDAGVETVDFNGPTGQIFIRQAQLRYILPPSAFGTFSFAIENPESDFFGSDHPVAGGISLNVHDPVPDFTARWTLKRDWGHVALGALARDIEFDTGTEGQKRPSVFGYGLELSGHFQGFFGKDKLSYQLAGGDGIGRYFNDNGGNAPTGQFAAASLAAAATAHPVLRSEASYGGYVGYQHWWAERWRSSLIWGRQHNDSSKVSGIFVNPGLNRDLETEHVNLFWSPVDNANLGIEYIHATRDTTAGLSGESSRLQFGAQYKF